MKEIDIERFKKALLKEFKKQRTLKESEVKERSKIIDEYINKGSRFYQGELRKAKITHILALGLIVTGVLILFTGIVLLYFGKISGGLTTAVGGISMITSAVLLKLHKNSEERSDQIRKHLDKFEIARMELKTIETIPDVYRREKAVQDLVSRLCEQLC